MAKTNILVKQIEIKCCMVAAISVLPRLEGAVRELVSAVEQGARPESLVDAETAYECSVTLEQFAAALEMAAKELREGNRRLMVVRSLIG